MNRALKDQIADQAARWLDCGDQEGLRDWLDAAPEHRRAYGQLDQVMRDPALAEALTVHAARSKPSRPRPAMRWTPVLAAAGVAGLAVLATLALPQSRPAPRAAAPQTVIATAAGQSRMVTLADGSRIYLNGDTKLGLTKQAGGRQARLIQGEALFDIRHDPSRPFTVTLDHGAVTDLGTVFNVNIVGDQTAVQVYSGKVRLNGYTGSAMLDGRQQADLTQGVVSPVSTFDVRAKDWRDGWIEPRDWPLARVVEALRRRSGVAIVIASPQLATKRITGRLRLDEPREELAALAELHGFVVRERNKELVLAAR